MIPQQAQIKPSGDTLQNDLERYTIKGMELLHDPSTRGDWRVLLKKGDPVTALAHTLVVLLTKMDAASRAEGLEINDTVKLYGISELLPQLCEIAENARIFKLSEDEQQLALGAAIQDYINLEADAGRIDKERLKAQVDKSLAEMAPEKREEVVASMKRMEATGKAYAGRTKNGPVQ